MTAREIALWFEESSPVCLPAIQRSSVWRPAQVEALWDSMCRGFPVGSFLLAPFAGARGAKPLGVKRSTSAAVNRGDVLYHLLDGQQRSTAIALGFRNPWKEADLPAALWVDLAPPVAKRGDGRKFIFRVVTRSHPWGYMRSDPDTRLEAKARRMALARFLDYLPSGVDANILLPGEADLAHAWPWDSVAPIPVSILVESLAGKSTRETLRLAAAAAASLPFWKDERLQVTRDLLSLDSPTPHVTSLVESLRRLADPRTTPTYRIPVQKLPSELSAVQDLSSTDALQVDPIETLFVRVNAGGTRLDGEELSYSILKSIWPDVETLVNSLSTRLMAPARLVMLLTRLLISRRTGAFPPLQDVVQFRRLVHRQNKDHPDFLTQLMAFLDNGEAAALIRQATGLLTAREGPWPDVGLPKVLVAEITKSCPDAFLLLLRWLDRCKFKGPHATVALNANKQIVGALTTFNWYGQNQRLAVKAVWDHMEELKPPAVKTAWNVKGLLLPAVAAIDGEFHLVPPISPKAFEVAVRQRTRTLCSSHENKAWNSWTWAWNFAGSSRADDPAIKQFAMILSRASRRTDKLDRSESATSLWSTFSATTWGLRSLVLYAQRSWLMAWFPNFDPARIDQIEDTDRPWDMDHIHAANYVKNIKRPPAHMKILKDEWHGCAGNFRAWPLELNRGDGDASPEEKLTMPLDRDERARLADYQLRSTKDLLSASFIRDARHWNDSTPPEAFRSNYLKDQLDHYPSVLNAIIDRWLLLYESWYRDCRVGHLF